MATYNISGNEADFSNSLFKDCEHAYSLINEGKEKQAEEEYPLEYHLIKKYLYSDFNSMYKLLEERLTVSK